MSKLDETIDKFIKQSPSGAVTLTWTHEDLRDVVKQDVKALFLQLIGEDEHIKDCPANGFTCVCPMWQQNKNELKGELRQKVNEL